MKPALAAIFSGELLIEFEGVHCFAYYNKKMCAQGFSRETSLSEFF